MKKTPLFRYVGLAIKKNGEKFNYLKDNQHAREIETNCKFTIGKELDIWDEEDMCTYTYRILRMEGTGYNKTAEEIKERRTA